MRITVTNISVPAMSTIGYGEGIDENGNTVTFIGDHRPMRDLVEALMQADGEEVVAEVEDWQIKSSAVTDR